MTIQLNPMRWLRPILERVQWALSHGKTLGLKAGPDGEPVPVPRSEQVPQNIGRTEPFLETELRTAVPLDMHKPEPGSLAHAEALLSWLQKHYPPGALLPAADVENVCYPLFLEQTGWRPRYWGSRRGVGKHLRELPGVKKVSPYIETEDGFKERVRCYQLPLADKVAEAVELAALKHAA
jgi:hypothetical protein